MIEIIEVTAENKPEQTVVRNLLKMYCCEWSQYNLMDVKDDGTFEFERYASLYWTKDNCHTFLVRKKGKYAGFAFVDQDLIVHKDYNYSLAEFFVMPKYRHCGVGRYFANAIFDRLPGSWEVGRHPGNIASVVFWDRVISDYTHGNYETVYAYPSHKYADGTLGDILFFQGKLH